MPSLNRGDSAAAWFSQRLLAGDSPADEGLGHGRPEGRRCCRTDHRLFYAAANHQLNFGPHTIQYDKVGRVTNVNDSVAGNIRLTYDALDRLTQEFNNNGTVSYAYL